MQEKSKIVNLLTNDKTKIYEPNKITPNNKTRNPGIDLLRILGMIDIVFFHVMLHGQPEKKYKKYYNYFNLILIYTQWHISSFGIISGIVGYKSHKYSNLLYLWLTGVFYSSLIHIFVQQFYPNKINLRKN